MILAFGGSCAAAQRQGWGCLQPLKSHQAVLGCGRMVALPGGAAHRPLCYGTSGAPALRWQETLSQPRTQESQTGASPHIQFPTSQESQHLLPFSQDSARQDPSPPRLKKPLTHQSQRGRGPSQYWLAKADMDVSAHLHIQRCHVSSLKSALGGVPGGTIVKNRTSRTSLVAQWIKVCMPMQGTRVLSLVWGSI